MKLNLIIQTMNYLDANDIYEDDSDLDENIDLLNYKGEFFNSKREKYQDPITGAHFRYEEVYRILKLMQNKESKSRISLNSKITPNLGDNMYLLENLKEQEDYGMFQTQDIFKAEKTQMIKKTPIFKKAMIHKLIKTNNSKKNLKNNHKINVVQTQTLSNGLNYQNINKFLNPHTVVASKNTNWGTVTLSSFIQSMYEII